MIVVPSDYDCGSLHVATRTLRSLGQRLNALQPQSKGKDLMTSIYIYVLADYNAGEMVGDWVDVSHGDSMQLEQDCQQHMKRQDDVNLFKNPNSQ